MEKIAVLLSTYNGNKYLDVQLESIFNQKGVRPYLIVRDDGSKDETKEILKTWKNKYPNSMTIVESEKSNLGSSGSFIYLMSYALENFPDFNYFSFADQDDYWFEDKLNTAYAAIKDKTKPALYYSRKTIADIDLKPLTIEDPEIYPASILKYYTISNASGCTFLFNRQLAEMCKNKPHEKFIHHDAWIYRIAGCTDSVVIYDERSYMLYRQHGENVVGKVEYWNLKKMAGRIFKKRNHVLGITYTAINQQFNEILNDEAQKVVPLIAKYRKSLIAKEKLCIWKVPYNLGMKTGVMWSLKVLSNGI